MRLFLALFLGFLIAVFPQAALAATLSLDPASGQFNKGCAYTVNIIVDTQGTVTDGTDAILFYDNSRLSTNPGMITPNTAVYPDFPVNNVDETAGRIYIAGVASVASGFAGKDEFATIQFTVKPDAPTGSTQVKFDFETGKTIDSNVVERTTISDALSSVINGTYTIGTGACVNPSPSPGKVATPSAAKKPIQGGPFDGTPSATKAPVKPELPPAGTKELTFTLAIVGSVLTVLGILGLALL